MAWDPVRRRRMWTIKERWPVWSGRAVSAARLVFYGNLEGGDTYSDKLLWQFQTGSGIIGQPTGFPGPDRREYAAWSRTTSIRAIRPRQRAGAT